MEKLKTVFITLTSLLLTVMGIFASGTYARAKTSYTVQEAFELQNVMDDLKGSTIENKQFNLTDYNLDSTKDTQLITFAEFCYSYNTDNQQDYGLYAYVYNPKGLAYKYENDTNEIHIRTGGKTDASFNVYRLCYLNQSTQAGYEGLFIKFRVELSDLQKKAIINSLNSSARVYEVGEIQLMTKDKEFEVFAGAKFTYTGYTLGYGSDMATEGTLKCVSEGGQVTLHLKPEYTAFRPDGSNGKNEFTQDSLHSVYFSVPNEIITEYGDISKIHAKWLNATLKPGLVTGNKEMYEKLLPIVAHRIPMSSISNYEKYGVSFPYVYMGVSWQKKDIHISEIDEICETSKATTLIGNIYNKGINYEKLNKIRPGEFGGYLDELSVLLYADNGNADKSKFNSTKALYDYVNQYPNVCPAELDPLLGHLISGADKPNEMVAGKYPSTLFSKYDTKYTEKTVLSTEAIRLEDYKVDKKWWQLFGYTLTEREFPDVKAIQKVTETDLKGSTEEICKNLCVGKADFEEFCNYFEKAKADDSTVFLFRFYQSDFIAQEATLFSEDTWLGAHIIVSEDTNAYFFQTDVNLNFDIIDISFTKGKTTTTIPVVMKPIDVIPNPTPPILTTPDFEFWKYGAGICGALLGVLIVATLINKGSK